MAANIKSKTELKNGMQLNVDKLGLKAVKSGDTPSIILEGVVTAAGTGASSAAVSTGGVASKVFTVTVAGVTYYIPLFSSNA